jgi:CubicO group peptidase (beta-lactamase class C family)
MINATRLTQWPVVILLAIVPALSQAPPHGGATTVDPFDLLAQRVASRAAAEFAKSPVGAMSVAVVADGRVIGTRQFGHVDGEQGAAPTGATLYRIGSMTKTFTALMLLQLESNDRCNFSDPVEKFLPQFANIPNPPPSKAKVTLIQLATHTGALAREPKDAAEFEVGPVSDWERILLRGVPKTSFIADPGSLYSYSNLGYAYLGAALGKAAGVPYVTYITQRILLPLGMRDSVFEVSPAMRVRLARGHVVTEGTVSSREAEQEHAGRGYRVPNGGLYSTLDDMTRWLRFQMGEPAPTVFDKDALAEAQRRITLSGPRLRGGYGIGIQTRRIGELVLFGHSGGVAGYQGEFFFEPNSRIGVVVLRSAVGGAIDIEAIVDSAFVPANP